MIEKIKKFYKVLFHKPDIARDMFFWLVYLSANIFFIAGIIHDDTKELIFAVYFLLVIVVNELSIIRKKDW